MNLDKIVSTHVDHMNSCLEATLNTMFKGECVTIFGLDRKDGHTWKSMTIKVEKVRVSSCYEVLFSDDKGNCFCHHKKHEVIIEGGNW